VKIDVVILSETEVVLNESEDPNSIDERGPCPRIAKSRKTPDSI